MKCAKWHHKWTIKRRTREKICTRSGQLNVHTHTCIYTCVYMCVLSKQAWNAASSQTQSCWPATVYTKEKSFIILGRKTRRRNVTRSPSIFMSKASFFYLLHIYTPFLIPHSFPLINWLLVSVAKKNTHTQPNDKTLIEFDAYHFNEITCILFLNFYLGRICKFKKWKLSLRNEKHFFCVYRYICLK